MPRRSYRGRKRQKTGEGKIAFRKLPGPIRDYPLYQSPAYSSKASRASFKLISKWECPFIQAHTLNTPALSGSAIVMNSLLLSVRSAYLSSNFGGAQMAAHGEYLARQKVYDRFVSTIVVGYRITLSDLICQDQAGDNVMTYFALTPLSFTDDSQMTNAHPNTTWPGVSTELAWRNCRMHANTRYVTVAGSGYDNPKAGKAPVLRASCRMSKIVSDPYWMASGAGLSTPSASGGYTEVAASGVGTNFRNMMQITIFTPDPEATRTTRYHATITEECWVEAFDPVLPGLVA